MKAEAATKLADEAVVKRSEALKAGRSEELTRYMSVLSRFHRYSFGNVMLVLFQCPTATRVAGFSTWKSLGRFVGLPAFA